jgi:hypothetical protein
MWHVMKCTKVALSPYLSVIAVEEGIAVDVITTQGFDAIYWTVRGDYISVIGFAEIF